MPEYRVTWEIDLSADSPRRAALRALSIQRDPDGDATVFDVTDARKKTRRVDLAGLLERLAATRKRGVVALSADDWREIYYAVEMKRLSVAEDNRQNGPHADGVDLAAWRRQMDRIAKTLGADGALMHDALTALIECADRVVSRWGERDLQFAVQELDQALAPFGFGTRSKTK